MPFSTDTSWPQGLLDIFDASRNRKEPLESRYYGPYDRLFNYAVVEGSFTLFLALQVDEDFAPDAIDTPAFMAILNQDQKPVLIEEIRDDRCANEPFTRQMADAQIRRRYGDMLMDCPIPRLYGLSLLGTSLRVYCGDKVTGRISPAFVRRPNAHHVLPPDFLEGEWDLDILSPEGLAKMQEIVAYIKVEATNAVV